MTHADLMFLSDAARALRRAGNSVPKIARRMRITERSVLSLLALKPEPEPKERAAWTKPDRDLLLIVHACRAEMEAAERLAQLRQGPRP